MAAAGLYDQAHAQAADTDLFTRGTILERKGLALYNSAFQAKSVREFRERGEEAADSYGKAIESFRMSRGPSKEAREKRCRAMVAFIGYWFASDATDKKKQINDCWRLAKETLGLFEESAEDLEWGRTFNQLSSSAIHSFNYEWDLETRKKTMRDAYECGERLIPRLSKTGSRDELARVCAKTTLLRNEYHQCFNPSYDEKLKVSSESRRRFEKAISLSEPDAHLEMLDMCCGMHIWGTSDERLGYFSKGLEYAKGARDNLLIGNALDILADYYAWRTYGIEDPLEAMEMAGISLKCAEEANKHYSPMSFVNPGVGALWSKEPYTMYYDLLGLHEADLAKKRKYFRKAAEYSIRQMVTAKSTGYPDAIFYAHHVLSRELTRLVPLVTDAEEKRRMLGESLEHRTEAMRIFQLVHPHSQTLGVSINYMADTKAELSRIEPDAGKKVELLREAVAFKEQGLQLSLKDAAYSAKVRDPYFFGFLARLQRSHGEMLSQLYELTHDAGDLLRGSQAFEEAAHSYLKKDMHVRAAECFWKSANGYCSLEDSLKASKSFHMASLNYGKAAEKAPKLREFLTEYQHYMDAWSQIKRAKHLHSRQEYGSAKESYERAAALHQSSRRWEYLASNYWAWAYVEGAEDSSRKEEGERAISGFEEAARLFGESKATLEDRMGRIDDADEMQMVDDLIQAADIRHKYCSARILLEEAKALDKKGEHSPSSWKYRMAANAFGEIARTCKTGRDKAEFELMTALSLAWEKMTLAKAERSPPIFLEASTLFERAKEHGQTETMKALALGHSHFCKAMEAGMRFIETMDESKHTAAIQQLGSALDYYAEAGFENASQYAKATGLLLDAYFYSARAKQSHDPEKKVKMCTIAETVLRKSISIFKKIGHEEKAQQISRLQEDIKEEREMALSLVQVMYDPLTASTSAFPVPMPTYEYAVGHDKFEHADIQANLTAPGEVLVGEDFDLRLDLFNPTNHAGIIVRIEDLIPPKIKIVSPDAKYGIEGRHLDLKGKRLSPLKIESVRLRLQAVEPGIINFSPRVVFIDETGKFKRRNPEPSVIMAREESSFEFHAEAAQKAFSFMVEAFISDYMKRKLPLEKSGWRTLMDVSRHGGVPKSKIYNARGGPGSAISELDRRGVVEKRVFTGERGRGGRILKLKIAYQRESVKRYIDELVMKNK